MGELVDEGVWREEVGIYWFALGEVIRSRWAVCCRYWRKLPVGV